MAGSLLNRVVKDTPPINPDTIPNAENNTFKTCLDLSESMLLM